MKHTDKISRKVRGTECRGPRAIAVTIYIRPTLVLVVTPSGIHEVCRFRFRFPFINHVVDPQG